MNEIIKTLQSMDIQFATHHHEAVFTVEEANKIESLPSQGFAAAQISAFHTKNLFLVDKSGGHHLVCVDAHSRLKLKDFGRMYGLKDLTFGSQESMMHELHTSPGSVSIFGMMFQTDTKLYLDPSLIDQPSIGRHPNDNTMTLTLSRSQIQIFLQIIGIKPIILEAGLV